MNYKKTVSVIMAVLLLMGLAGCAGNEKKKSNGEKEEIAIPMILTVDPSAGTKNEEEVVKAFNLEYKGTYRVAVDWIMETEEEYRKNLKRLNVTGGLPAVITHLRMLPSYYQMMMQEERIEDLSSYIYEDEEWMESIEPAVLDACSEPDGSVYLAPLSTAAFSCSGVFWNEELFRQAGIREFPQTWEEFWNCCEKLKAHGITPLALHTEGTAWAPMLFATAELAASPEGAEFMKELFPQSYQNQYGIQLATTLKQLFTYTTEDAIHVDFDVAHNNFVSGRAAMISNGYWMIDQIPEEFAENVRFSAFPGNQLISSPETFGWAVVSDYEDEVKEGAIEFLKFRTLFNQEEKERFWEEAEGKNQMMKDYINAYDGNPKIVPNYQVKWNSVLQEETLGECLPKLVNGEMSVEEFVRMEDESIRRYEDEL
ncbi:ABC transporter substrate-binding protein [Lachnospiraceae bacterium 50-23]|nr:putative sugar-binding periplasmic protein [Lachnospiraceae bacterium]